jgi:hypothetical protein
MYPRFEPRRGFFAGCRYTAIGNLLLSKRGTGTSLFARLDHCGDA